MDRLSTAFDELDIDEVEIFDDKLIEQTKKPYEQESDIQTSEEWQPNHKEYLHTPTNFSIPKKLYNKLYPHQKEGVAWLSSLYQQNIGGILGDDMGLGKTYQSLTYLGGLFYNQDIRNAIIVCPVSLLRTWENEAKTILKTCCPEINIIVITSSMSANRRHDLFYDAIGCCKSYPYLVITTYGLVSSNPQNVIPHPKYHWDFVVLDEGHQIKNRKTKKHIGCSMICKEGKTRRLLLTGTPIQNNLEEMWSLFDWSTEGRLLGDLPA